MPTKIEIRGLGKSFPTEKGRLPVIEDVSLTVDEGGIYPSGYGISHDRW
jgi:ABC-type glutathione transport system ATPase component